MAPMKGGDVQSADSLIRAVLRKTAHVHHSKQSAERRAEVRRSFYGLDESEDGKLSLEEFMESTEEVIRNASGRMIEKIFSYVDEDKSGFLEFDEFLVFTFIMESGFQFCDGCLSPVIIAGYTCKTCWSQRGDESHDTYDLCATCYASDAFDHAASHELVDTCHMYHYLLTNPSPPLEIPEDSEPEDFEDSESEDCADKEGQVQCSICDEYHAKDLESLLVKGHNHVELEKSSSQEFICEWCASYMCIYCGKYFSEASYDDAKIDQWIRDDLCCGECNEEGKYKPNVDSLLELLSHIAHMELLEESEIPKKCSTCAKNLKNGTLGRENRAKSTDLIAASMANNLLLQQSYFNARMANNLLLQQSYFSARMVMDCGAALASLA